MLAVYLHWYAAQRAKYTREVNSPATRYLDTPSSTALGVMLARIAEQGVCCSQGYGTEVVRTI